MTVPEKTSWMYIQLLDNHPTIGWITNTFFRAENFFAGFFSGLKIEKSKNFMVEIFLAMNPYARNRYGLIFFMNNRFCPAKPAARTSQQMSPVKASHYKRVARSRFELLSRDPEPRMIDRYTTGLYCLILFAAGA